MSVKYYCISIVFFMLSISSMSWITENDVLRLAVYKFCALVLPLFFLIFRMYSTSLNRLILSGLIICIYGLLYILYSAPVALNFGGLILLISFINLKFEYYFFFKMIIFMLSKIFFEVKEVCHLDGIKSFSSTFTFKKSIFSTIKKRVLV